MLKGYHKLNPRSKNPKTKKHRSSNRVSFRHPRKDKSSINSQAWRKAKALRRPLRMFEKQAFGFIIVNNINKNRNKTQPIPCLVCTEHNENETIESTIPKSMR